MPTFRAYADLWLETRKTKGRELRPTTRRQYRMLLDKFILPTFGDEPIDRISNEAVNAWYDALAPGRETIRPQSYSLVRTIFASAASERPHPWVPYNPAHIRGAGSTKRAHQVQPASLDELRIIVEELPDRYKLMALLAAWCAMRFGELAELHRGDIDLRTNRVKIRRGVVRVDGKVHRRAADERRGEPRRGDPAAPGALVKDHLKKFTAPGRDALLSLRLRTRTSTWRPRRCTRSTTRPRRPPDERTCAGLRHTGAVLAAQTGATLAELMGRLGHSTPGAAMRYQHAGADRDAEIARRLSALVSEPTGTVAG